MPISLSLSPSTSLSLSLSLSLIPPSPPLQTTGLDVNLIKENPQGFHFHGNIGPNVLTPHLDDLENGITQIEQAPGPDEAVEPVKHRLNDIERKIEELGGVSGPRHEVAKLEKRIVQLEKKAADP